MNICVFGTEEDKNTITAYLAREHFSRELHTDWYSDYDDFVYTASKNEYDIVFVTVDNAEGMEGVIAAKMIFQSTPIIWLSNDSGFGAQSYRLQTAYFHTKPITADVLKKAIEKCEQSTGYKTEVK